METKAPVEDPCAQSHATPAHRLLGLLRPCVSVCTRRFTHLSALLRSLILPPPCTRIGPVQISAQKARIPAMQHKKCGEPSHLYRCVTEEYEPQHKRCPERGQHPHPLAEVDRPLGSGSHGSTTKPIRRGNFLAEENGNTEWKYVSSALSENLSRGNKSKARQHQPLFGGVREKRALPLQGSKISE